MECALTLGVETCSQSFSDEEGALEDSYRRHPMALRSLTTVSWEDSDPEDSQQLVDDADDRSQWEDQPRQSRHMGHLAKSLNITTFQSR